MGVLVVYNFTESPQTPSGTLIDLETPEGNDFIKGLCQMVSGILSTVDTLHELYIDTDML